MLTGWDRSTLGPTLAAHGAKVVAVSDSSGGIYNNRGLDLEWDDFRRHLIAAIDAAPERPYWESFAAALHAFTSAFVR